VDLIQYLAEDPDTRVIALYVEGFGKNEGRHFVETAREIGKPVVVLKAGKSAEGSRAANSHTAALAGDYRVFSEVLAQYGVIEAGNEFEMVSFCESLSCYHQPIEGKIGIITASGGHGVLATDVCATYGLSVPLLTEANRETIRESLSERLRAIASVQNPIDLTGSAEDDDFVAAAAGLSQVPDIDCVLLLLLPYSPGISSDLGARMSYVFRGQHKPLVAYVPHQEKYRMLIEGFELNNVPVSSSIDGAVLMAEALRRCRPC
jgi:acetyltransferase